MSITQKQESDIITVDEFVDLYDVARSTVYAWVHQKRIPHYKPNARILRFKRSEIDAFMLQNRVASQSEIDEAANTKVILGGKK